MNNKNCEGCLSTIKVDGICSLYKENIVCPCSICLIKVICVVNCELLIGYTHRTKDYSDF